MSPRARLLAAAGALVVAGSIALEVLVPADHGPGWRSYFYHHAPGFFAALGLAGCWLLVVVSKGVGRLLQRPEGYWGEPDLPAADEPDHVPGDDHE